MDKMGITVEAMELKDRENGKEDERRLTKVRGPGIIEHRHPAKSNSSRWAPKRERHITVALSSC